MRYTERPTQRTARRAWDRLITYHTAKPIQMSRLFMTWWVWAMEFDDETWQEIDCLAFRKRNVEWSGAICQTCYKPVYGGCGNRHHMDGRIKHPVVVRELSR